MGQATDIKFIVDNNVAKLAKWLRIMGYDTLLFRGRDDSEMVDIALSHDRVILTRDTQITKRRLVSSGRLKVILIEDGNPKTQLRQVVNHLGLDCQFNPFSRCLECNQRLLTKNKEEVCNLVPPHVFQTQTQYMECPSCHNIYWRGTHWQAMNEELENLLKGNREMGDESCYC